MVIPYTFLNVGVWNIHSLFSNVNNFKFNKLEDAAFEKRLKMFDILCLQEIQCGPKETQSIYLNGYRLMIYAFHRKISNNGRYYGGSLLLIKNEIREGIKIISDLNGDKIWIKMENKIFNFERDIYICFLYVPPLTSIYVKNLDYDLLQEVEGEMSRFSATGNVILAGDFNAKTNIENDFVSDIQDNHSPINEIEIYLSDKPIRRENQDEHPVDLQGQRMLDLCKCSQLRILNGRTKGDRTGKYTRFPLSVRESPSTLDYILTDLSILKKRKYFTVLRHFGLSDHECLLISIETQNFNITPAVSVPVLKDKKFMYANPDEFLMKVNSPIGIEKIKNILTEYSIANETNINAIANEIIGTLMDFSVPTKQKKKKTKSKKGEEISLHGTHLNAKNLKGLITEPKRNTEKNLLTGAYKKNYFLQRRNSKGYAGKWSGSSGGN